MVFPLLYWFGQGQREPGDMTLGRGEVIGLLLGLQGEQTRAV